MGFPLQDSTARQLQDCPQALRALLESILTRDACKNGLPTLAQLGEHQFFRDFVPAYGDIWARAQAAYKPQWPAWPSAALDHLKVAVAKAEQRLHAEQRSVRNQKRIAKVQEAMSTEEERKVNQKVSERE